MGCGNTKTLNSSNYSIVDVVPQPQSSCQSEVPNQSDNTSNNNLQDHSIGTYKEIYPIDFNEKNKEYIIKHIKKQEDNKQKVEVTFNHKKLNTNVKDIEWGYEDEFNKDKNINYGKPLKIYNQTWLTYDFEIKANTISPILIDNSIPIGWRIPSITDYLILIKNLGNDNIECMVDPELLNMNKKMFYITSTKYNKNATDPSNENSYRFKCIGFDRIVEINESWSKKKLKNQIDKNQKYMNELSKELDIQKLTKEELEIILKVKSFNDLSASSKHNHNNNEEDKIIDESSESVKSIYKNESNYNKNNSEKLSSNNKNIDISKEIKSDNSKSVSLNSINSKSEIENIDYIKKYKIYRSNNHRVQRYEIIRKLIEERQKSEVDSEESYDKNDLIDEFNKNINNYNKKTNKIMNSKDNIEYIEEQEFNIKPFENIKERIIFKPENHNIKKDKTNNQKFIKNLNLNIFDINCLKENSIIRCKLIANEILENISFNYAKTGYTHTNNIFTIPLLYNITSFKWDFDDESNKEIDDKSTLNKVAVKVYNLPGEYNVKLSISLFHNRIYTMKKPIWIMKLYTLGDYEIIDDVNYGKPIKLGKQIWMTKDLKEYVNYKMNIVGLERGKGPGINGENSYIDSVSACPTGWRLPFRHDFEELLDFCGNNNDQRVESLTCNKTLNIKLSKCGSYNAICFDFKDIDLNINFNKHKNILTKENNFNDYNVNKSDNNINKQLNQSYELLGSNENTYKYNYNILDKEILYSKFNLNNKDTYNKAEIDSELLNKDFLNNVKMYNQYIIKSMNFNDIYNKKAYCLSVESNNSYISTRSTSIAGQDALFSTRLIAITGNFDVSLGTDIDNIVAGEDTYFNIKLPNITKIEWLFYKNTLDNQDLNYYDKFNVLNPIYKYNNPGNYNIEVSIEFFGHRTNKIHKIVTVKDSKNLHKEESNSYFIGPSQIIIIPVTDAISLIESNNLENNYNYNYNKQEKLILRGSCIAKRNDFIHFKPLTVPLCLSNFNYFIISFYDYSDLKLKLFKMSIKKLTLDDVPFFSYDYAIPLSIDKTNKGYCILCSDSRDSNYLYILAIDYSGKVIFNNTIMQNGNLPILAQKNQLIFFDNNDNTNLNFYKDNNIDKNISPVFGMNAMHTPISGKVKFGNNKICVIFSYYNYFGTYNGIREDHNGDTIIMYSEDGLEVNLVNNWNCSHSLTQKIIYDGKNFVTCSLGDAYPHNIKIVKIDPVSKNKINDLEQGYYLDYNTLNNKLELVHKGIKYNDSFIKKSNVSIAMESKNEVVGITKPNISYKNYDNTLDKLEIKDNNSLIKNTNLNKKITTENDINNIKVITNENKKIVDLTGFTKPIDSKIFKEKYVKTQNNCLNEDINTIDNFNKNNKLSAYQVLTLQSNKVKVYNSVRNSFVFCNALEGSLTGNLKGKSSGRLGNLLQISDNKYMLIYSRIPCHDVGEVSNYNEFGIIIYKTNLNAEKKVILKKGDNITSIKAANYGKNIFIAYTCSNKMYNNKYNIDFTLDNDDTFAFLVDENGELLSDYYKLPFNLFSASDDLYTLDDGSVVWPYVDNNDKIYICCLNLILNEEYILNNKDFLSKFCYPLLVFNEERTKQEKLKASNNQSKLNYINPLDYLDYDDYDVVRMKLNKQADDKMNEIKNNLRIIHENKMKEWRDNILNKDNNNLTKQFSPDDDKFSNIIEDKKKLALMEKEKEKLLKGRKITNDMYDYYKINNNEYDNDHGIYLRDAGKFDYNTYKMMQYKGKNYHNTDKIYDM